MHPILPDGGEVSFPQGPGLEVGPGQLVQTQNLIAALMAAAEADGPFQSNDHSLDKSDPFG